MAGILVGIAIECSAYGQPLFNHNKPLVWQFGDDFGAVDLLQTADKKVQLIFAKSPILRQKMAERKIGYLLQLGTAEIEEMISIVDKNGDGKISYSEFRVMMGAFPLLMD